MPRSDPFVLGNGVSPIPVGSVVFFESAGAGLPITFTQTVDAVDPGDLISYTNQKVADGWSSEFVTRHILTSLTTPMEVYLRYDSHFCGLEFRPIADRPPHPTYLSFNDGEGVQKCFKDVSAAIVAGLRTAELTEGALVGTLTMAVCAPYVANALTELFGQATTVVPVLNAGKAAIPPTFFAVSMASLFVDGGTMPYFAISRPDDNTYSIINHIRISGFYALSGAVVAGFPLHLGLSIDRANLSLWSSMDSEACSAYATRSDFYPDMSDATLALGGVTSASFVAPSTGAPARILAWLAQYVPDYDYLTAVKQKGLDSLDLNKFWHSGGSYQLPGLYVWGINRAVKSLAVFPAPISLVDPTWESPVALSPILGEVVPARPLAAYHAVRVDTKAKLSFDSLSNDNDLNMAEVGPESEHYDTLTQLGVLFDAQIGRTVSIVTVDKAPTAPSQPLSSTRLYAQCQSAGYDILSETLIAATVDNAAVTFSQANNRCGTLGRQSVFSTTDVDSSPVYVYDEAEPSSEVVVTITRTGTEGAYFYTPSATYSIVGGAPSAITVVEQLLFYCSTGATLTVVHSDPGPDSDAALTTYLNGSVADVSEGVSAFDDMQLSDTIFDGPVGPNPSRQRDNDMSLRCWFVTKGIDRRALEEVGMSVLTAGQLYPSIGLEV
jgi:hypothetical protein